MGKIKARIIEDKSEWEKFILGSGPKSFLQSWDWGDVQSNLGNEIFRYGFYENNKLIGVSQYIGQNAKRGRHLIVPGGPIIDWSNTILVERWISTSKDISKKGGYWFFRIRPELLDNAQNRTKLEKLGFVSSPMHLHSENTWILNIRSGEEEIMSGMRKNTRYMVRKAIKSDLKAETTIDFDKVDILYDLQKKTAKRHGFVGFSKDLFKAQIEIFGRDDLAKLYLIKKEKEVLVAAIIIFYGDYAYYHHSASSEKSRDYPASYLLQWQVIKDAKKRGLSYYNFWGIAPKGRADHRFSGVTTFKKGFGGKRIDWLHAMDYPVDSRYWLTNTFEKIRKKIRNL
ncbi:peptidoglycan bridge formation glycyltransferase FemA/FemB family protein [Candidatus Woesebacteria bacterium]|nr:peptidoglycan bridge formation glycyltransferase FemA/FemB family protein [Candidatus Woesebacteria bacterium]